MPSMTDPLIERHLNYMDDKPRVMFSCEDDWTPSVVEKLKPLTDFKMKQ
jgi:hypothetical protein